MRNGFGDAIPSRVSISVDGESARGADGRCHALIRLSRLVIEPFIVPSLFEANEGAVDEWTLSEMLAAKGPGVLESTLRYHYETFITEQDFAEIAGAGL